MEQNTNNYETEQNKKSHSLVKCIAGTGIFSALAYLLSFLEFSIFPTASFLKLDFSAVFVLLGAFAFGPLYGVIICAIKELLCFLTKSTTGGVGEIANFLVICSFILLPSIIYRYRKGLKVVLITLIIACVLQIIASLLANRFITFPLFMKAGAKSAFHTLWPYVLAFNAIKSVSISVITVILYKRVSFILKKF